MQFASRALGGGRDTCWLSTDGSIVHLLLKRLALGGSWGRCLLDGRQARGLMGDPCCRPEAIARRGRPVSPGDGGRDAVGGSYTAKEMVGASIEMLQLAEIAGVMIDWDRIWRPRSGPSTSAGTAGATGRPGQRAHPPRKPNHAGMRRPERHDQRPPLPPRDDRRKRPPGTTRVRRHPVRSGHHPRASQRPPDSTSRSRHGKPHIGLGKAPERLIAGRGLTERSRCMQVGLDTTTAMGRSPGTRVEHEPVRRAARNWKDPMTWTGGSP